MNRILFPTDLSDISKNALDYTTQFAKLLNSDITVLHAHSFQDDLRTIFLPNRDLWGKLSSFVKDSTGKQPDNISLLMKKGKPLEEILNVAGSSQYKYIVMSKKKSYNVYRRWTGSKTKHLISKASHPILVVPENTEFHPIRNILVVGANYETLARPLQEQLLLLSLKCKANLHYLEFNGKSWSGKQKQLHKDQMLIQKHIPSELAIETFMDYVPDNKIDLIVMATDRKEFFKPITQITFSEESNGYREVPMLVFNKNFLKHQKELDKKGTAEVQEEDKTTLGLTTV